MGMLDFLKKNKAAADLPEAPANTLLAVQNGKIVPVDTLPDPVFAEKVLGDGYAIDPTDGKVLSPVSGKIVDIQDSLHAYGIETPDGLEVLVHIGINTVSLNGAGFRTKHKVGDTVHAGELLAEVNLNLLEQNQLPKYETDIGNWRSTPPAAVCRLLPYTVLLHGKRRCHCIILRPRNISCVETEQKGLSSYGNA